MTQKLSLTFLILIAASRLAFSQYNEPVLLGTTGYFQAVTGYSVSYSVGEIAVTTESNSNFIITQGFQQPDTISKNFDPCPGEGCLELIKIFPNPVKDNLTIRFYKEGVNTFFIEIYNTKGKIVRQGKIEGVYYGDKKIIDFADFPKELYIVRIYSADKTLSEKIKVVKI